MPSEIPSYSHKGVNPIQSQVKLPQNKQNNTFQFDQCPKNNQKLTFREELIVLEPQLVENQQIISNSQIVNIPSIRHSFNSSPSNPPNHDCNVHQFQKNIKQAKLSEDQDNQADSNPNQNSSLSEKLDKYLDLIGQHKKFSTDEGGESLTLRQQMTLKYQVDTENLQKLISKQCISVTNYQQCIPIIRLQNICHFANYQIVKLDVRVGKYQKKVTVYNLLEESCFHFIKPFNSGSFGNIYLSRYMEKEFVVKCITKTSVNHNQYTANGKNQEVILVEILKEYMIAYIAGLLEIGPKVVNPFGFDLIVSRKCIEFFIERVQLPQYHLENIYEKFEQIKKSLLKLHLLNIVHNDIKPQNIMYSESTKKLVFIDFGLSEYIDRPIGHKKLTNFIGTYQYSSPEMQKLLFQNENGLIDLYYNDAYSLNMALNKLFQIQEGSTMQQNYKQSVNKENQITSFLNKIFLKYLILEQNTKDVITLSNIIQLKRKFQLQQEILNFLQKMPFSPQLKHFYHQSIHYSVKDLPKFTKLQDLYFRNVSPINVKQQYKDQNQTEFKALYQHFLKMQLIDQQGETTLRQRCTSKSQKMLLIQSKQQNFSKQQIFSLYLDLVHFLKRTQDISLQQKAKISLILIKKFLIPQTFCKNATSQISHILEPIFQCLYYLMKYCLTKPLNKWKTQNFVSLTAMLITLGWDIPDEDIKKWRNLFCTRVSEVQQIIHIYLEFMILERLSIQRFFKIYNEKSLYELNQTCLTLHQQSQLQKFEQKSVYQHLMDQRKRQKTEKKQQPNQAYQSIFISMLQFDQNPQSRTEEKLDLILKQIQLLPYSLFKNQKLHQWTKMHLVFWASIHLCTLRIEQQKQLKILLKIKKQTQNTNQTFQIHIFTFQLLSKYTILKNFSKLNQGLCTIDQTINSPLIADNICLHRRFMRAFITNDYQKIEKIVDRIQNMRMIHFSDINLIRHVSICYQNLVWLFKKIYSKDNYRIQLHQKIQHIFHNFAMNFKKMTQLRKQKINRQVFSEFLRAIFAIRYNSESFQKMNTICENQQKYLEIFDQMLTEYPDREMIKSFTLSKINLLRSKDKFHQICQFIETQDRLKLSTLSSTNYIDLSIIIEYYRASIMLQKDKDFYIVKFRYIYDDLVEKKCFFNIFNNRNFFDLIAKVIQDSKMTFQYFKIITQHITRNPSIGNTLVLINYMNSYMDFARIKVKQPARQAGQLNKEFVCLQEESNKDQQKIDFKMFQFTSIVFKKIYQCLKSQIKKCRIWQNPYLVLILFFFSMIAKVNQKELRKIHILTAKAITYMNYLAKKYILNWYYWRVNSSEGFCNENRMTLNLNVYLNKKHLKNTFNKSNFEQILDFRIKKNNYPQSFVKRYPGYMQVRQKIFKYYNNAQLITIVNHLDVKSFSQYQLSSIQSQPSYCQTA